MSLGLMEWRCCGCPCRDRNAVQLLPMHTPRLCPLHLVLRRPGKGSRCSPGQRLGAAVGFSIKVRTSAPTRAAPEILRKLAAPSPGPIAAPCGTGGGHQVQQLGQQQRPSRPVAVGTRCSSSGSSSGSQRIFICTRCRRLHPAGRAARRACFRRQIPGISADESAPGQRRSRPAAPLSRTPSPGETCACRNLMNRPVLWPSSPEISPPLPLSGWHAPA